jgi:hypothetical protein
MATSDLQAASAAERQKLLRTLFTSAASEASTDCRDPKVLEAKAQEATRDLLYSSFASVNPKHVAGRASAVASMLSRHAQTSKLNAFNNLKAEYVFISPAHCHHSIWSKVS